MTETFDVWADGYDPHLRTGNVAELARITYLRGVQLYVEQRRETSSAVAAIVTNPVTAAL